MAERLTAGAAALPPGTEIAQIVADGRPGGGSTMVLGLIDDLRERSRCRVTLISQPSSYLEDQARRRGLPYIACDFFTAMADVSLPWRLSRRLAGRRFGLSHLHGIRAAHHAVRWPLRPLLGRLVYTVHGLHQLHAPAWLRWLVNRAERQVMQRSGARVFVSKADESAARQWRILQPGVASEVVCNGVGKAEPLRSRDAGRDVDVAFIGRHVEQKAPLVAARVLAALAARGWNCLMVGDGPLRPRCTQLLARLPGGHRVVCRGELAHDEVLQLLPQVKLLIMPSLWEGLPILPIEAMAAGVPVVATRLPGTAEVIADAVTGLLTPPGDADAMVTAVLGLLQDGTRLRAMQAEGLAAVERDFDRARAAERYLEIYARLLAP